MDRSSRRPHAAQGVVLADGKGVMLPHPAGRGPADTSAASSREKDFAGGDDGDDGGARRGARDDAESPFDDRA